MPLPRPLYRRRSIRRLNSLVVHHQKHNPFKSHDLHVRHSQVHSDDGYSDSDASSLVTPRNATPNTNQPNSPTKGNDSPNQESSPPHHHDHHEHHHHHQHHHHHHDHHPQSELLISFTDESKRKLHKGIAHFGALWLSMALNKWHEFIELQIWNNLDVKARKICSGTTTLGELPKSKLDIVMEWIDGVCGTLLNGMSKVDCRELVSGSEYHEVLDGEPLFFQGDRGKHYWIVLSGEVRIAVLESNTQARRKSKSYNRRQSWLAEETTEPYQDDLGTTVFRAGPGVGFGQIALISKNPIRSGSCLASKHDTTLLAIPKLLYNQHLAHLHKGQRNLDSRIEYFKQLDCCQHWTHARLMHLAFAVREKSYPRGSIVLDGRKLVETAKKEELNDRVLDLVFIQEGLVEYGRYLKSSGSSGSSGTKKLQPQGLAICGKGRIFAAPGGSFCDPNVAEATIVKALRKTNVYCVNRSYFTSASSTKRTDMVGAKAMFKRTEQVVSKIHTKRAQLIQKGIDAEQEILRMRAVPLASPKLSAIESGVLEALYPYPNEGPFTKASSLTYDRLVNHNSRRLAHMAELDTLEYQNNSKVPLWATGCPVQYLQEKTPPKKKVQLTKAAPELPELPEKHSKKETTNKDKGSISWKAVEPAIVVKTRTLFKTFYTRDESAILMGMKL